MTQTKTEPTEVPVETIDDTGGKTLEEKVKEKAAVVTTKELTDSLKTEFAKEGVNVDVEITARDGVPVIKIDTPLVDTGSTDTSDLFPPDVEHEDDPA